MTQLFERLNEKASFIANLHLVDLIMDVDLLAVALCADVIPETVLALKDAQAGDYGYIAAHKAIDLGFNSSMRSKAAKEGYFAKGLRGLLNLAALVPDTGARLMPVFYAVVSNYRYYGIPKKLKSEIESYMEHKRQHDGFAIMHHSEDGNIVVKAADGLFED